MGTAGFYVFTLVYFFTSSYVRFDSISTSIEAILIVTFCIFFLFDQLTKPQVIFIYQDPSFWVVSGLMVYLSGTLFLFILINQLDDESQDFFWKINYVANVIKNILFAISFSISKSKTLTQSFENEFDKDFLENPYKY